jgi:hypothetical protein
VRVSPQVGAAVAVVHGQLGRLDRADGASHLGAEKVASTDLGNDETVLSALTEAAEGGVLVDRY